MLQLLRTNTNTGNTGVADMAQAPTAMMAGNNAADLLQQELNRASAVRLQLERETQMARAYQAGLEFACQLSQQQRQQQLIQQSQPQIRQVQQVHQQQQQQQQLSDRIQLLDGSPGVTGIGRSSTGNINGTAARQYTQLMASNPSTKVHTTSRTSVPVVSTNGSSLPSQSVKNKNDAAKSPVTSFASMSNLANAWTTTPAPKVNTMANASTHVSNGRHDTAKSNSVSYHNTSLEEWTTAGRARSRETRDTDRSSGERRSAAIPPNLANIVFRSTNVSNGQTTNTTAVPAGPVRSTDLSNGHSTQAKVVPVKSMQEPPRSNAQVTTTTANPAPRTKSTGPARATQPFTVDWGDIAKNIRLPFIPPGSTNPLPLMDTPNPDHQVIYLKYRIAELMQREKRTGIEEHFLTLLVAWARKARVPLPQASDHSRLLALVQQHRRISNVGTQGNVQNGSSQAKTQNPSIQTSPAFVPASRPAAPSVTPAVAASVAPPVPSVVPVVMQAGASSNQAADLSSAAIEQAKPPALALMELLRLGGTPSAKAETPMIDVALNTGSSSLRPPKTSVEPPPTPPPPAMPATSEIVQANTVPNEARLKGGDTGSSSLACDIPTPKAAESRSSPGSVARTVVQNESGPPIKVDVPAEVKSSESTLAAGAVLGDDVAAASMQDSDVSRRKTVAERRNQIIHTLEIETDMTSTIASLGEASTIASPGEAIDQSKQGDLGPLVKTEDVGVVSTEAAASSPAPVPPLEAQPKLGASPLRPQTPELPPECVAGQVHEEMVVEELTVVAVSDTAPPTHLPDQVEVPIKDPYGVVNLRTIRSIPANKMWVEIPVPRPRPVVLRPRSPSPHRFKFCLPEEAYDRFGKECTSKVLSQTLLRRLNPRPCGWDGCDAELGSEWQLEQHVRRVHVPRARPVKRHHTEVDAWVCSWNGCDRPFQKPEHLNQHLQAVHVQQGLVCPYRTCHHRDTVFPNVHVLEIHISRSPILHKRENVVPLTDLSVEGPGPLECQVPSKIRRDALLPVKVFRTIWPTDRIKRNAINKVQEFSFVDRESPRMRPGESPPPMDMPMPAPVLQEEESMDDDADAYADADLIVVKVEGDPAPYALRRIHQTGKSDLVKAKTGSKPTKREMEVEVVLELARPVITGC